MIGGAQPSGLAIIILIALGLLACAQVEPEDEVGDAADDPAVVLETSFGDIRLIVHEDRAPVSARNFLAYVEGGHYDGATFYRRTQRVGEVQKPFTIVQGGILGHEIATLPLEELMALEPPFAPIAHEATADTGLANKRGVVAFARGEPGTASSEFFINVTDNPVLDTSASHELVDGAGFATFATVTEGMDVVDRINSLPADGSTRASAFAGTILNDPVVIIDAYVAKPSSDN